MNFVQLTLILAGMGVFTRTQGQTPAPSIDEFLMVGLNPDFWDGGQGLEVFAGSMIDLTTSDASPTKHLVEFNQSLGLKYFVALDCDPHNKSLYFLESTTRSLYRVDNLDTTFQNLNPWPVKIHEGISDSVGSIALDWVTKTVYWTDREFGWIAMQPSFANDSSVYHILFINLNYPGGIAVDPIKGFLFWYDMPRGTGVIERSTLSGEDRQAIIHQSVGYITDMATDPEEERLYWIDNGRGSVESMSYYGTGRRTIRTMVGYAFASISVAKDDVCVIEYRNYFVACFRKTTGETSFFDSYWWNSPGSLTIYDKSLKQPETTDACKIHNCEQICAIKSRTEHKCLCKEGYKLNASDGTSCIADHYLSGRGILIANSTHVCKSEVRSISGGKFDPVCITGNMENTTHLVADAKAKTVYFYDYVKKEINYHVLQESSNTRSRLATTANVSGLTLDWIDKELFWSESDTGLIKVINIGTAFQTELYRNMNKAFSIQAAPHNKTLYWLTRDDQSDGTIQYNIYEGQMDGSGAKIIVNSSRLTTPTVLHYDVSTHRIFWLDNNVMHTTSVDGQDERTFFNYVVGDDLLVYKRYAIWRDNRNVLRARAYTGSQQTTVTASEFGDVVGMCLFDETIETTERGPCSKVPNGGCQEICLPSDSGPVCKCDFGYNLNATDKKSCYSHYFKTNFFLISDVSNNRLYQVSMDGSNISTLHLPTTFYTSGSFYDKKRDVIYITDATNQAIRRVNPDGTNFTTVLQFAGKIPERMDIDYSTDTVYYSVTDNFDTYGGYVGAISTKYNTHRTVMSGLEGPRGLAVLPAEGYLFVADNGRFRSYIFKAWMDGSNVETLVDDNIASPLGLAVDYVTKRVYWVDNYYDRLESIFMDGTDRKIVLEENIGYMSDLVIYGSHVYYVGINMGKIEKVDKTNGAKVSFMDRVSELGPTSTIQLIPGENQLVNAQCRDKNGDCGKYCFPTPQGRRCGCPDGVALLSDMVTCAGDAAICDDRIPYGGLVPDINCHAIENYTCEFQCVDGYRQNISHSVRQITCQSSGQWTHPPDTLCEEISCPRNFANGEVTPSCQNDVGRTCGYKCNSGYTKTQALIGCQSNGQWDFDEALLCKKNVVCNNPIPNGRLLSSCSEADSSCPFRCNQNYNENPDVVSLHCRQDGQYSMKADRLCIPQTCPPTINNVIWKSSVCSQPLRGIVVGTTCEYSCAEGYKPVSTLPSPDVTCLVNGRWALSSDRLCTPVVCNQRVDNAIISTNSLRQAGKSFSYECEAPYKKHTDIYLITCLSSGRWNVNPSKLCTNNLPTVQAAQKSEVPVSAGAAVGLTLGICVIIVIILLVVLYIFFIKRKQTKARFVDSPNVRFSGRNEFTNPTLEIGGVSNPNAYSSEMQPPQNPVYDNIQEKPAEDSGQMKSVSEIGNPYHKF